MKRIVIDARESGTSTGRYIDKLVEYLHKLKPDYEFVLLAKPHRLAFFKEIAPNFKATPTKYKEFTFSEQLGFRRQIARLKADLVFFPMVQQPILYRGKTVTTINDLTTIRFSNPAKNPLIFWAKQQVYKAVTRIVARKSLHLLTFSRFVKDDIAAYAHINPAKITPIYLAADKITTKPEPFKPMAGKEFIMYVGRPLEHKNLKRLVDAFKLLLGNNPDLQLVLAGKIDESYKQLQNYVKQREVPNVAFTDFVSDGQLRWLYENAAVYVFPSLSEGFGLPGLEAMQYGLPVASSNATCLPELYKDAAQYFNPFSASHMAAKIQKILDDPKLANQLAASGRVLVGQYSWQRTAKQTLAVFEAALRKK